MKSDKTNYKKMSRSVICGYAMVAVFANVGVGVSIARAEVAPMSSAKMAAVASQDADMKDMMGAPLPFGIMTGHAGQWMLGYQYMFEIQNGLLDGSNDISLEKVLTRFDTTPTDMTMKMNMGMLMYSPTDNLTIMAMLPYIKMSMGELHRDGTQSTERSEGFGDLEMHGSYSLYAAKDLRHRVLVNFGIAFPTGSVNQHDEQGARMEYPMQTGSGTYSLLPGVTYLGQTLPWSWGAAANATARLGKNEHGYALGNRYEQKFWVTRQLSRWMSLSAGTTGELWKNVRGSDSLLDPADEPTKDPNVQGGKRLDAFLGLNFNPVNGFFKGQQFHIQGSFPALQSLDGPQLKRRYMLSADWQRGF